MARARVDPEITYDESIDAAYIYLGGEEAHGPVAWTYPCDPVEVRGQIHLDFDAEGRLTGIEVLDASTKLLPSFLSRARTQGSDCSNTIQ